MLTDQVQFINQIFIFENEFFVWVKSDTYSPKYLQKMVKNLSIVYFDSLKDR